MKIFTLFGDPVHHSRSPLMHNSVFKELNINACYTRTHQTDDTLLRRTFLDKDLSGANITVPHKEAAFLACDEVRGIASAICAVNTIINEDGKLIGYNTDADGFIAALRSFGDLKTALILGAGGTARALALVLRQNGINPTILNRSSTRLEYFAQNNFPFFLWNNFSCESYDIIINTTSAGLNDDNLPAPLPQLTSLLQRARCAIDVIYGKETPFLTQVKYANIPHKDGSDMLLEQGVLANYLFLHGTVSKDIIFPIMEKSFLL